jgi:hypothetical protein
LLVATGLTRGADAARAAQAADAAGAARVAPLADTLPASAAGAHHAAAFAVPSTMKIREAVSFKRSLRAGQWTLQSDEGCDP